MFLLALKKKFVRNLTILTLGISALTMLIFKLFIPEQYFAGLPFIPLCFYLYGVFFINVSVFIYQHDEAKLLTVFFACRGLKFFLSLIAVVVCGILAREFIIVFSLTYIVYYLVYLVIETWLFFSMEMESKNKKS